MLATDVERLVDRLWCLSAEDEEPEFVCDKKLTLTFLVWDHVATGAVLGCVRDESAVRVVIRYDSIENGAPRVFFGDACLSDHKNPCHNREAAELDTVNAFLRLMRSESALRAYIVFDGQMDVTRDFELHLHFDHPIAGRSLLVKSVLRSDNPLTVIDSFK